MIIRLLPLLLALILIGCTVTVHPALPTPPPLPTDNLGIAYRVDVGSDVREFLFANERDTDGRFVIDVTVTDSSATEAGLMFKAYNSAGDTIGGWTAVNTETADGSLRFRLETNTMADDIATYVIRVNE